MNNYHTFDKNQENQNNSLAYNAFIVQTSTLKLCQDIIAILCENGNFNDLYQEQINLCQITQQILDAQDLQKAYDDALYIQNTQDSFNQKLVSYYLSTKQGKYFFII